MKKIEDYLHLYIGCQILDLYSERIGKLHGVNMGTVEPVQVLHKSLWGLQFTEVKPILRRLSSMTKEEGVKIFDASWPNNNRKDEDPAYKQSIVKRYIYDNVYDPFFVKELLSYGFDLFRLIDEGLAIDAATLETKVTDGKA